MEIREPTFEELVLILKGELDILTLVQQPVTSGASK
jgi:hypothetical protein